MGTIWAGGSGRAGSCRSGRAWQPLPHPPWHGARPPQVSQAARGGGEAWLGSGAGQTASLSGPCFLRAPSQTRGRGRGRPSHCQAAVLGPTLQPLCLGPFQPQGLCTGYAPPVAWHTLTQISLWPNQSTRHASPHPSLSLVFINLTENCQLPHLLLSGTSTHKGHARSKQPQCPKAELMSLPSSGSPSCPLGHPQGTHGVHSWNQGPVSATTPDGCPRQPSLAQGGALGSEEPGSPSAKGIFSRLVPTLLSSKINLGREAWDSSLG